jgi:arsenate reductase
LYRKQLQKSDCRGIFEIFCPGKAEIYSAGIETHGVNPKAVATMKEDGIDISPHFQPY